ncbi:MAG: anaerobic ribonucleoside-triphosphate reductase activating protein [Candidatus Bathyarchaeia archaeon]
MRGGRDPLLRLGGITDISTVDWYGNVSMVVFFAGCNFRCPYCQNAALVPATSGEDVDLDLLRRRIDLNRDLLDAVVFTGGEPLLQAEGLMRAAEIVKDCGLKVMLDTNGSAPQIVEKLLDAGLLDRVALDVKAPLAEEDYGVVIGLPDSGAEAVRSVDRTLELCNGHDVEIEVRTTVAPTISDDPEFIGRIASGIRGRCDVYILQQFDNTGGLLSPRLKGLEPPGRDLMVLLAEAARGEGVEDVYIKTREMGLERVG